MPEGTSQAKQKPNLPYFDFFHLSLMPSMDISVTQLRHDIGFPWGHKQRQRQALTDYGFGAQRNKKNN